MTGGWPEVARSVILDPAVLRAHEVAVKAMRNNQSAVFVQQQGSRLLAGIATQCTRALPIPFTRPPCLFFF